MAILGHLNAKSVIRPHQRLVQNAPNIKNWFVVERMEVDFGESVGRPTANITMNREYITKFLENGWTIVSINRSKESGKWEKESSSRNVNHQMTTTNAIEEKETSGHTSSESETRSSNGYSHTKSNGSSSENSDSDSVQNTTVNGETGAESLESDSYWYAVQTVQLQRRRMSSEKVLDYMVNAYVDHYNVGSGDETRRFNDLVTLYSYTLEDSEYALNYIANGTLDIQPFIDKVYNSYLESSSRVQEKSNAAADLTKAAEDEVNRKYDSMIAAEKSRQIGIGMYSSTMWSTVEAGYERQRAAALVAARAAAVKETTETLLSAAQFQSTVGVQIIEAKQRLLEAVDKRNITAVELRNSLVKSMVDFIGSKDDVYPQIHEISQLAERIGFSVGASGSVL